ncbi:hypothetical protein [Paenibacillus polymyxa]|uniref:hypothetical protein n=1 Tax=Paenibacillus polymyxa TaxID=1406 RepID=UPI00287F7B71|nr:hypothetical protein [Paenibacillus polymyxa]
MKKIFSIVFFLLGIMSAVYVGFYIMFVGGMVGLIDAVRATTVNSYIITINIVKILFAGFVGYSIFYISTFILTFVLGRKLRRTSSK